MDRGKPGSKIHVLSDRAGLPLAVAVSAANTHDSQALPPLVQAVPAIRSRCGPRRRRPAKLPADTGYDYPNLRRWLHQRGITPRIARRGIDSSTRLGRHRWRIEPLLAHLFGYRRLATQEMCRVRQMSAIEVVLSWYEGVGDLYRARVERSGASTQPPAGSGCQQSCLGALADRSGSNWARAPKTGKTSLPPLMVDVDLLLQGPKADRPLLEQGDGVDEVAQGAAEPVQPPDHQGVAGAGEVQRLGQPGPVGAGAAGGVGEDPFAAGGGEASCCTARVWPTVETRA